MDFDEIVERCGWNDQTVITVLRDFIAEHQLETALNCYVRVEHADEIKALDDCSDCQGTGIGNPRVGTPCPSCRGKGYIRPAEDEEPEPSSWKPRP